MPNIISSRRRRRSSRSGSCRASGRPAELGRQAFPKGDRSGRFVTLASGFAEDADALPIRADARVLGATLKAGESVTHEVGAGRHAYLVPAVGRIEIDGEPVNARDGAALASGKAYVITAIEDAEIVLVDSE